MGGSCGKGRSVIESVWREVFGLVELLLEAFVFLPKFQCDFLLFREVKPFGGFDMI
jgi:hypothetical protein